MYDVIFYSDCNGTEPIAEYISELRNKSYTDKNARINFNKMVAVNDGKPLKFNGSLLIYQTR